MNENVSRETYEKLEIYKSILFKWQKAINLVSRGTLDNVWKRHFQDSLQIIPYIRGKKILDIGSGGGFPGMVLAIAGNFSVTCIDSDRRKMLFLSEVARATKVEVSLVTDRVENLQIFDFDTLCARGFSELSGLLELVDKFSSLKCGVFLKGARLDEEIDKARSLFDFRYDIFNSKTDDRGKIIVVSEVKKKAGV